MKKIVLLILIVCCFSACAVQVFDPPMIDGRAGLSCASDVNCGQTLSCVPTKWGKICR